MIFTWNLDPIAFYVLGHGIRWYGIAYVVGFFLCLKMGWRWYQFLATRSREKSLIYPQFESLLFGCFVAGIAGGRLGHFLFFDPQMLETHPWEVLQIWHGGMSIQGGILGAVGYGWWRCRRQNLNPLQIADSVMIPLALALALGRVANFFNGELVGKPTAGNWGIIFPHIDDFPRHVPVLYESVGHLILALILGLVWYYKYQNLKAKIIIQTPHKDGLLTAFFLVFYGTWRFFVEFVKMPLWDVGPLTSGQWLCLVMIIMGAYLWRSVYKY